MKKVILGMLLALSLVACSQPSNDGAYVIAISTQVDKVEASPGESITITVRGGFEVANKYFEPEFTEPGVNLGACLHYTSDRSARGGLCVGGERPLPDGLRMANPSSIFKDFGNITVKRGQIRRIEHTFTFTSDGSGVVEVVPAYLFKLGNGRAPYYEPGVEGIIQITFR